MHKDPACLFYIDTWLSATAEMDSDVRGWYLNLILHQYDKKDLPNDLEKLAVLAGVKFSEFERFKQMFEQVLKQKFEQNENNRLENSYAKSILSGREQFKDKRQKSGNIGVVVKLAKTIKGFTELKITKLKNHLYTLENVEIEKYKNEQLLKQMLKQLDKLYINENENEDEDEDIDNNKRFDFKTSLIKYGFDKNLVSDWLKVRKTKKASNTETVFKKFISDIEKRECDINKILEHIVVRNWSGFNWEWYDKEMKEKSSAKKENTEPIIAGRQTMSTIMQNMDMTGVVNHWAEPKQEN